MRKLCWLLAFSWLSSCDSDDAKTDTVSGSCSTNLSETIYNKTASYKTCMSLRNIDAAKKPEAECTSGSIFSQAGTWSTSECTTADATASCEYSGTQKQTGIVYNYNADLNGTFKSSCDKSEGSYQEITAASPKTASLLYTYETYKDCQNLTSMSSIYREAMKDYYATKKGDLGTWTWTDDGTCPTTNVKAKCTETSDVLQRIILYYDEVPADTYKTDCQDRKGKWETL